MVQLDQNAKSGTLYGVGVGPGDPELLTLKGHRLIATATTICYPAPANGESFARQIVKDFMPKNAKEIVIEVPMVINRFPAREVYDTSAREIGEILNKGEDVVVLCEGDPFFYGSFIYLFERLKDQVPTQVVPGVSSIMSVAAELKTPHTIRNDVLSVIPGPLQDEIIKRHIERSDAIAIMKVGRHLPRLRALIDEMGLLDYASYVERSSLDNQHISTLRDAPIDAPYFSVITIHKNKGVYL